MSAVEDDGGGGDTAMGAHNDMADSARSKHVLENLPQGKQGDSTALTFHMMDQMPVNGLLPTRSEQTERGENILHENHTRPISPRFPNMGSNNQVIEQMGGSTQTNDLAMSPPPLPDALPGHHMSYGYDHTPEPKNDSAFMHQISSHFNVKNITAGNYKDGIASEEPFYGRPLPDRTAHFPRGMYDMDGGLPQNIPYDLGSRGLQHEAPQIWNTGYQQPYSTVPLPAMSPAPPAYQQMASPFAPPPWANRHHIPDEQKREPQVAAQNAEEDHPKSHKPSKHKVTKRKHVESEEEEEEEESPDEYEPSESASDEEFDSDSDSDAPLMDRYKKNGGATHHKRSAERAGSDSHSEYDDEGGEDEDGDHEEDSQDQATEKQGDSENETSQPKAVIRDKSEPSEPMEIDFRTSSLMCQDVFRQQPREPSLSPFSNPLPENPTGEPARSRAIERVLPVFQPEVGPAVNPDEISWRLPRWSIEVMPIEKKDDPVPIVRVNLPGMYREELCLTEDHAQQEIDLIQNVFLPSQQALAEPDPEPQLALLNFHTIATLVLEAYTAYEEGDQPTLFSVSRAQQEQKDREKEALDATKDEIFFAVMDRWRVGKQERALRPAYGLIRGVQEFCDIALDIIYYLEEHGFVGQEQGYKAADLSGNDGTKEGPKKKRGPAKGKGAAKGAKEPKILQARKKPKTEKDVPKKAKGPGISVIPRAKK